MRPRPCRRPGCMALCRDGSGYCEGHKKQGNWEYKGRKSRQARGYGRAWEKLRLAVLKRDSYLCQPCIKRSHYTQANEVDHIHPKSKGGADEPENLQAICTECHRTKTGKGG